MIFQRGGEKPTRKRRVETHPVRPILFYRAMVARGPQAEWLTRWILEMSKLAGEKKSPSADIKHPQETSRNYSLVEDLHITLVYYVEPI
jgi:hypothetical protein